MSNLPALRTHQAVTARRVARLGKYVDDELMCGRHFICSGHVGCRRSAAASPGHKFLPGTMGHVGKHFDLTLGDKPLRVVVVGQEAKDTRVTLDKRYHQVHDLSGLRQRQYSDGIHDGRNPHMRGTTWALRVLFGKGLGTDREGEFLWADNADEPFHIFDAFALLNRLLCYAGPEQGVNAHATSEMFDNCARHLQATLSILKPTILVLQGKKVAHHTKSILTLGTKHSDELYEAYLGKDRILVCAFTHPAAYAPQRWADRTDYLEKTVRRTLLKALHHL